MCLRFDSVEASLNRGEVNGAGVEHRRGGLGPGETVLLSFVGSCWTGAGTAPMAVIGWDELAEVGGKGEFGFEELTEGGGTGWITEPRGQRCRWRCLLGLVRRDRNHHR